MVWTRSGGGWTETRLPVDPTIGHSNAKAVASDPTTGEATAIGGWEMYVSKSKSVSYRPRLWIRSGGTWQRIVLPLAGTPDNTALVLDINADLVAVGNAGSYAVVWEPNGTGGWTAQLIGPFLSDLKAINGDGTLTVGRKSNVAAYWQRVGGAWTGPFTLPGGCAYALDVDDLGRILMTGCPVPGAPNSRSSAAVIVPPYGSSNITMLGGFGDQTTGPAVEGISRLGTWIVGSSTLKSAKIGAYWKIF